MAIYYNGVNVTGSESGRSKFKAGTNTAILKIGGNSSRVFFTDIIIFVPQGYTRVYCSFSCLARAFDLPSDSLDKIYARYKQDEFGASNVSENKFYSINGSIIHTSGGAITIKVGVILKAPYLTGETSVPIDIVYSLQEY